MSVTLSEYSAYISGSVNGVNNPYIFVFLPLSLKSQFFYAKMEYVDESNFRLKLLRKKVEGSIKLLLDNKYQNNGRYNRLYYKQSLKNLPMHFDNVVISETKFHHLGILSVDTDGNDKVFHIDRATLTRSAPVSELLKEKMAAGSKILKDKNKTQGAEMTKLSEIVPPTISINDFKMVLSHNPTTRSLKPTIRVIGRSWMQQATATISYGAENKILIQMHGDGTGTKPFSDASGRSIIQKGLSQTDIGVEVLEFATSIKLPVTGIDILEEEGLIELTFDVTSSGCRFFKKEAYAGINTVVVDNFDIGSGVAKGKTLTKEIFEKLPTRRKKPKETDSVTNTVVELTQTEAQVLPKLAVTPGYDLSNLSVKELTDLIIAASNTLNTKMAKQEEALAQFDKLKELLN